MVHPAMLAKAHALVAADATAAHRANGCCYPGAKRRKHKPYTLPARASMLVEALRSGNAGRLATMLDGYERISSAG